jgi:hypothetical protein
MLTRAVRATGWWKEPATLGTPQFITTSTRRQVLHKHRFSVTTDISVLSHIYSISDGEEAVSHQQTIILSSSSQIIYHLQDNVIRAQQEHVLWILHCILSRELEGIYISVISVTSVTHLLSSCTQVIGRTIAVSTNAASISSGVPRNFVCWRGGGGSANSVEDRGQRERGSGGGSPLVKGSTQFANALTPYSN